jgi:Protein of unknown function (DUF1559)
MRDELLSFSRSAWERAKAKSSPLIVSVRRTQSDIEMTERYPPRVGHYVVGANCHNDDPVRKGSIDRGRAQMMDSINNMKQIMLAMYNYREFNTGRFPPAYNADNDGKPLLSWRVLILPYFEYTDLYNHFHLDEPWDSEHNKKLIASMPPEYISPNSKAGEGTTNYLTVRGENTVFPGKQGMSIQDILDGPHQTIAMVEASDEKAVIWTKPDDFECSEDNPLKGLIGLHPDIFLAAFADASVKILPASINPQHLRFYFMRNSHEPPPR